MYFCKNLKIKKMILSYIILIVFGAFIVLAILGYIIHPETPEQKTLRKTKEKADMLQMTINNLSFG